MHLGGHASGVRDHGNLVVGILFAATAGQLRMNGVVRVQGERIHPSIHESEPMILRSGYGSRSSGGDTPHAHADALSCTESAAAISYDRRMMPKGRWWLRRRRARHTPVPGELWAAMIGDERTRNTSRTWAA
jgi:hypothetical protein